MSNRENKSFSLKTASKTARKMLKHFSYAASLKNLIFSIVILSIGITLGIAFDEFELFLGIAVALNVILFTISENNNI